ncbi:hypothetical protein K2173_027391 [Erythroxylum novogranatense]|uniref:UspA domain-containing protein n=1 Tax=Erythroxylum novogranatense TaxID=1862640 RepID=A0AAV8U260_9ROSI|nr:hypothetical protein K2173_027391 [Erythroxylum novogranatense]
MDARKIVVVVEDVDAARTALKWALNNLLRDGDMITLLHVFCPLKSSRNKNKMRLLRLEGYQLALSFKDICCRFIVNTKVEIIITEGEEYGEKIAATVRKIGAFALVVGLHDQSFLYRLVLADNNVANKLNCRVLAIKQAAAFKEVRTSSSSPRLNAMPTPDGSTSMDICQIQIGSLDIPEVTTPKFPYTVCPDPSAILWRWRKSRRKHK